MGQTLFGTDGIRGEAGRFPIDVEGGYRLGRAVAATMVSGAGKVCIGRDSRPSGAALAAAVAEGVRDGGCHAIDLGVIPTPAVAFHVAAHGAPAGVSVSASHNPARENGFKLFGPGGEKVTERVEDQVAEVFLDPRRSPARLRGRLIIRRDAVEEYVRFAVDTVPRGVNLRGLKVAVDCAHGATCRTTPEALARLGIEVVTVCADGDGSRINADCGSLHPHRVQALVRTSGASLGLAHDGDGDRLVIVDEHGQLICGDKILGLAAQALHERRELRGGHVVGTIMSNFGLERWLQGRGMSFHRSAVGDRNVWTLMRSLGADLGGEPSGHTIFRRLSSTDDALLSALQVLSLMALSEQPLCEMAGDIPMVPQEQLNLRVTSKPAIDEVAPINAAVMQAHDILRDRGRLIVRYSGTESVARILAEGPDSSVLAAVVSLVKDAFVAAGLAA